MKKWFLVLQVIAEILPTLVSILSNKAINKLSDKTDL